MTKLEELINELCPNGVEYKYLWELTIWDKKFNSVERYKQEKVHSYTYYLASDLKSLESEHGTVKILTTNQTNLWANEYDVIDTLSEREIVCIPWGGNPIVQYYNGKFITGDNRIATSKDTNILSNKYLYYVLLNRLSEIASFYRGSGIKHPDMSKVLNIEIPVPPLPVQEEIVRILDSFTELTARKKQYEYYRDELIEKTEGRKAKLIDMLIQPVTDGPHTTPKLFSTGVPFVSATAIYDGKVHLSDAKGFISYEFDKECSKKYKPTKNDVFMVKSGSTTGKVAFVDFDESFNIWSPIAAMRTNKDNLPRFLFHLLHTSKVQEQVLERMSHGSQPNLSMRVMEKFDVCIPSLSEQQRIVDILDRFDTLCNDISTGLPAEIEARQKQYEYYRDKLLTFKRLEVNK